MEGEMSVCDCGDPPEVWRQTDHKARKPHKCNECGSYILIGEKYRYTFGIWEGDPSTHHACLRCIAIYEYVRGLVPCACWMLGNLHQELLETAREYARESPGLLFGTYRRIVLARRGPQTIQASS
jgi:hypothetical protein